MDRIKEALGLGPGTFVLKLDSPAIPAGGFVRGTYDCKLKKVTDVQGLLARATALRGGKLVYEQTQHLEGQPQVSEGRWTLVFRIPREIKLAEELLPSELRELTWTISVKLELGLKSDPESAAHFDVLGAFPDGVPTEPGAAPVSGTSLERVVNVLAADTVSAANRVSERLITPHVTPAVPDYERGHQQSSRQAEARAEADAQEVRQRLGAQRAPGEPQLERGAETQPLEEAPLARGAETQILRGSETQPLNPEEVAPTRRRVEKPPIRVEEPIVPRPRESRRVEKPPVRLDQPIVMPRSRRAEKPVEPSGEGPAESGPEAPKRRRVEKPPLRIDEPILPRSHKAEDLAPKLKPEEPKVEDPPRRRVEKPPVQLNPKPSKLPQPSYQSDQDLRWKKPGKKK